MATENRMFASLLKYWRGKRGLSQLDLALQAGVSTKHISFLETGRSQPSKEMVLRLLETLDLPLRERNSVLLEAGFEAQFPEPNLTALDSPGTKEILHLMMEQQRPYPLIVMDRWYDILLMNEPAELFVTALLGESRARQLKTSPANGIALLFQEDGLKSKILDWERVAKEMLARLYRELLHRPNDERLSQLLNEVLATPDLTEDWRNPDLSMGTQAVIPFGFKVGEDTLEFVTTMTVFSTPQNVTLAELQIESYFPLNKETEETWKKIWSNRA